VIRGRGLKWNYEHVVSLFDLKITLNVSKITKKTGKITKKRAKNGRFSPNARLNGHARLKTGDLATLI